MPLPPPASSICSKGALWATVPLNKASPAPRMSSGERARFACQSRPGSAAWRWAPMRLPASQQTNEFHWRHPPISAPRCYPCFSWTCVSAWRRRRCGSDLNSGSTTSREARRDNEATLPATLDHRSGAGSRPDSSSVSMPSSDRPRDAGSSGLGTATFVVGLRRNRRGIVKLSRLVGAGSPLPFPSSVMFALELRRLNPGTPKLRLLVGACGVLFSSFWTSTAELRRLSTLAAELRRLRLSSAKLRRFGGAAASAVPSLFVAADTEASSGSDFREGRAGAQLIRLVGELASACARDGSAAAWPTKFSSELWFLWCPGERLAWLSAS
eukprot:scaffold8826_cov117-Isochrysis_galbana.AAC.7